MSPWKSEDLGFNWDHLGFCVAHGWSFEDLFIAEVGPLLKDLDLLSDPFLALHFELFDNLYDDGTPFTFVSLEQTEGNYVIKHKCDYISNVGIHNVGLRVYSSRAVSKQISEYTIQIEMFESCFKDELEE